MNSNSSIDGLYELPNGRIVDLSVVVMISPISNDEGWHQYTVTLLGGLKIVLTDNRPVEKTHLKRDTFIEAWRQYKLNNL